MRSPSTASPLFCRAHGATCIAIAALAVSAATVLPASGQTADSAAAGTIAAAPATPATSAQGSSGSTAGRFPSGAIYLYDIKGTVNAISGSAAMPLERHRSYAANEPVTLRLDANASCALVFSNGVGLWAKGPASFTVRRYEQQPFSGNSRSAPYEPTQSYTDIDLLEGTFSLSSRNLSAMSPLRLSFAGNNLLEANEASELVLEIGTTQQGDSDRISVLAGRALLHHGRRGTSLLIGGGQFLELQRHETDTRRMLLPRQLTSEQKERDARLYNHAHIANDRVWFTRNGNSPADSAQAQVALPATFWLTKPHEATRVR